MTGIILGTLFILVGIVWAFLAFGAAGMASRSVTTWEEFGRPALGLIPIAIGVALIIWR